MTDQNNSALPPPPAKRNYWQRNGLEFDVAINVLTGGDLGETVSMRCAKADGWTRGADGQSVQILANRGLGGCIMCKILGILVQPNHCREQFTGRPTPNFDMLRAGIAFAFGIGAAGSILWSIYRLLRMAFVAAGIGLLAGCTSSIPVTAPAQTATQQLIVAAAEAKALASLPRLLPPRLAYVDSANFTGGKYELAAFKAWLLAQGVKLTDVAGGAQMIVAPYVSVDSYNQKSFLIGIPALRLTALLATPQIAAYADTTEIAISRIAFYAYDVKTGAGVAEATSRYGIQPYSVMHTLFIFTSEYPKLDPSLRAN